MVGNHLQPRWPSNTSAARTSRPCIFTGGTPMHPDKSNRDRWGQTAHATAGRRHAKLRACPRRPRPRRQRGWPLATPEWLREAVMPSSNTVMGVFQFDFSCVHEPTAQQPCGGDPPITDCGNGGTAMRRPKISLAFWLVGGYYLRLPRRRQGRTAAPASYGQESPGGCYAKGFRIGA